MLLSDAILSSCAASTFFDPLAVGDLLLADGGLWANNPSIIALTEAVSEPGGRRINQGSRLFAFYIWARLTARL